MITIIVCMAVGLVAQYFFIKKQGEQIGDLKKEIKILKEIQEIDQGIKCDLNHLALTAYQHLNLVPGMKEIANHGIIFHTNKQKDYAPKKK